MFVYEFIDFMLEAPHLYEKILQNYFIAADFGVSLAFLGLSKLKLAV